MPKRVTLREIAKVCGYHYTTISLALRNSPNLPAHTRDKILRVVEKMGYRPDPMLKALSAYRQSQKPALDHGILAWLSNTPLPTWSQSHFSYANYLSGARERASTLGFRLEEFSLRTPGMTDRRMTEILRARGIQGVLVAPQPWGVPQARIEIEWSAFSSVTFGYSLKWPILNLVADNHFNSIKIALRELQGLGYQRIGLYMSQEINTRTNGAFYGGFVSEVDNWPKTHRIAAVRYKKWNPVDFRKWVEKHQPEAIILDNTREIDFAIDALKVKVPEEIGMVSLNLSGKKGYACVGQHDREIGAKGVDLVVSMINMNQRGLPALPSRLLIDASWRPGKTIRRLRKVSPNAR